MYMNDCVQWDGTKYDKSFAVSVISKNNLDKQNEVSEQIKHFKHKLEIQIKMLFSKVWAKKLLAPVSLTINVMNCQQS